MDTNQRETSEASARELSQLIQQAAQAAAQASHAAQTAAQTAQQVGQAINDMAGKVSSGGTQVLQEETGFGERLQTSGVDNQGILFANAKRTFDAYQHAGLEHVHNNQRLFDQAAANLQTQLASINSITTQHLQNAVAAAQQTNQNIISTSDMQAKQYLKHSDLAADSYWNPVSAGAGMNLTAGAVPANRFVDTTGAVAAGQVAVDTAAIGAAVAKSVDASITPVLAVLQQIVQALSTATTSIANVVNQAQPKTP